MRLALSIGNYKISQFYGINQSVEESYLPNGYTSDAYNMNTDDGNLSVAGGFSHHVLRAIPCESNVERCTVFHHKNGDIYLAFSDGHIYVSFGTVWLDAYTYSQTKKSSDYGFLEAKIGTSDCLLIANGKSNIIKFDGSEFSDFGSEQKLSDKPVKYLAIYKNRLFCAGDENHPNRLYWSKLPGDNRSIEDWGADESSVNVEGGHTQVGQFDNDPIVAITALSSQLLIFKKNSIYRLYGDRPSNFTVEQIESVTEYTPHTSVVHYGDVAYFMTSSGMYVFDGVTAHATADSEHIKNVLKKADFSFSKGARTKEKLFFTAKMDDEDIIIEYNRKRRTYMLRKGFEASDIFSLGDRLCVVSDKWVCVFDGSESYAGQPINAYWKTPFTDLDEKTVIKQLDELYLRGDKSKSGTVHITACAGGIRSEYSITLTDNEITHIPLCNEGRCFCLEFSNENGGSFSLKGGIELIISMRGRCG